MNLLRQTSLFSFEEWHSRTPKGMTDSKPSWMRSLWHPPSAPYHNRPARAGPKRTIEPS